MAKIFIYGSCVSRDTFELLSSHTLLTYIARQSLISASSPETSILSGKELESKFQNRSLSGDLKSSLFSEIKRYASSTDFLLLDIIDERLGVLALPDGTYITHSVELERSGRLRTFDSKPVRINLGSEHHFKLWRQGALKLRQTLMEVGLFEQAIIVNIPWADQTDDGKQLIPFRGISSSEMNHKLSHYYSYLQELGFHIIEIPSHLAVSTQEHKWGPSPFHYTKAAYLYMAEKIEKQINLVINNKTIRNSSPYIEM